MSGPLTALRQEEEARLLHVAVEQAIHICEEPGLLAEMPSIFSKERNVLARVPVKAGDPVVFTNDIMDITSFMDSPEVNKATLKVDEATITQLEDIGERTSATIEFAMMPIPSSDEKHPIFAVGASQKDGHVYYQHLVPNPEKIAEDTAKYYQEEFYLMLKALDALPYRVATDGETADLIEPLAEKLQISIIVQEKLPIAAMLVQELFYRKESLINERRGRINEGAGFFFFRNRIGAKK
ncbi:hypothetical protein RWE15_01055 [Virgibacillus halophilus]|uniref:DUF6930 domain-containing protein n=1 Tax=Tigheibacillus halophilus TaxID=361280 RepID=A0ABU5C1U2_9BACI|nr:hypothetical protein [Virgibacillus halophilus]